MEERPKAQRQGPDGMLHFPPPFCTLPLVPGCRQEGWRSGECGCVPGGMRPTVEAENRLAAGRPEAAAGPTTWDWANLGKNQRRQPVLERETIRKGLQGGLRKWFVCWEGWIQEHLWLPRAQDVSFCPWVWCLGHRSSHPIFFLFSFHTYKRGQCYQVCV